MARRFLKKSENSQRIQQLYPGNKDPEEVRAGPQRSVCTHMTCTPLLYPCHLRPTSPVPTSPVPMSPAPHVSCTHVTCTHVHSSMIHNSGEAEATQCPPTQGLLLSPKRGNSGVPAVAQQKQTRLVLMRTWVRSLASLRCCQELWHGSQMQLGTPIAVAVA